MIAVLQFLYRGDVKFICTGQIFPPDRYQFIIMIFTVFGTECFPEEFSETINNGNCAHGQRRCWKSNVLN